jgi:hypothetical protein
LRYALELEHEPRRRFLLERLHLLEALAVGHGEHVLAPAQELDGLHDAAREALLLERGVDEVARDRDRDPAFFLEHAEGDLLAGLEHDPRDVAGHEGADRDPRHADVADDQHARGRAPLRLRAEQRLEEARDGVDGYQPLPLVEDHGRGQETQVAADRGEALAVVEADLPLLVREGHGSPGGVAHHVHAQARDHLVDRQELDVAPSEDGKELAPLALGEQDERDGIGGDQERGGEDENGDRQRSGADNIASHGRGGP